MYKYSVILGNLGNTCDRFCKGYKDNPSTEEMLAEAVKDSLCRRYRVGGNMGHQA